jgi:uncharacterized protein (DUF4213/DUF364 family)
MSASSLSTFKVAFYRRPWFLILISVIVVVAVSIITDLPSHATKAQDRTTQNETIVAINGDLAPCVYSVKESFSFYNLSRAGKLTNSERSQVPSLLVGDQTACSFASGAIYDLTNNIQVTDTKAGRHIDQMLAEVVTWATSDALAAIEDIQSLFVHEGKPKYVKDLKKRESLLILDRAVAFADVAAASAIDGKLKDPALPLLPHLSGT